MARLVGERGGGGFDPSIRRTVRIRLQSLPRESVCSLSLASSIWMSVDTVARCGSVDSEKSCMVDHWLREMCRRGSIDICAFGNRPAFFYCKSKRILGREDLRSSTRKWIDHEFKSQGSFISCMILGRSSHFSLVICTKGYKNELLGGSNYRHSWMCLTKCSFSLPDEAILSDTFWLTLVHYTMSSIISSTPLSQTPLANVCSYFLVCLFSLPSSLSLSLLSLPPTYMCTQTYMKIVLFF